MVIIKVCLIACMNEPSIDMKRTLMFYSGHQPKDLGWEDFHNMKKVRDACNLT